jgi:hypothetical protein
MEPTDSHTSETPRQTADPGPQPGGSSTLWSRPNWHRLVGFLSGILLAWLVLLSAVSPASASPPGTEQPVEQSTSSTSPFRGSTVTFEQSLAHRTFRPGGQLTYDPYYNLELEFGPKWWPAQNWYLSGWFSLSQELTHSDVTTREDEIWPSDLRLTGGSPSIWTVPGAEINVATEATLILPTSKPSRARTLLTGLEAQLGLSRRFSLLNGLTLAYSGRLQKRFHQFRTSQLRSPRISNCSDLERGCDPFLTTGIRNPSWRQIHTLTVSLQPVDKLSLTATGGVYVDHLYPAHSVDTSWDGPIDNSNTRHTNLWIVDASYQATSWMSVAAGLRTIHPQLAPDSSYYTPVFNRYAEWTADLAVDVPALVNTF